MADKPAKSLRQLAEEKAGVDEEAALKTLQLEDAKHLFHELRVYQIELELQNEELRRTQHELELSRARYFSLYDLAPVGYLTISEQGLIQETNLFAATLLGIERRSLLKKPISQFIVREDQDIYYLHRKKIFECAEIQDWEIRMVRPDGSTFWGRMLATPACSGEYWITLTNIDKRKQAEYELKRNEEALKRQNMLFSTLLKILPMGVFMVEAPSGKPLVANEAAFNLLGRGILPDASSENLSNVYKATRFGRSEVYPPEEMPILLGMSGKASHVDDMVIERPDGTKTLLDVTGTPVMDDNGQIWASLVSFFDISERKQAEQVLQARLTISDYALDHSLEALLTKILDEAEALTDSRIGFFHFVDADQVTLALQAWSSNTLATICTAEASQQHYPLDKAGVWADCVRERRPLIHNNYESMPERKGLPPGHAPIQRELVVPIFRNNLIVAVLGVGNRQTDYTLGELAAVKHLANLAWDIVVRKQAEQTLKSAEMKYSRLFESMTDAYVFVNMEGRIVESNAPYQKLTGYSAEELSQLTYVHLTPEKWHAFEEEIVEHQVLIRGYSDVYQKEYLRKDGTIINVELKTYLLKDDAGKAVGMWAIIRDITDRKQAERELRQAKEDADAANRAKSDFLATMSHEIRTPLSAMLGNIELLEGSPLAPQQQEYLKDCKSASQMLLQVINDVLDFSKIEAGKLELANETFSISSLGRQLVRIFSASANQKGLDLTVSLAGDLPEYISCDQQRLSQVIANLISNAIKFTTHGTISLEISCDQGELKESPGKALLRILVTDTGVGIHADKQEQIFESFTQLESFSTRTVSGTGLGLPICRRLLGLMGGSIEVSSVPGSGAVFTVLLPVTLAQTQAQNQPQAQTPATHPRNILLADDDLRGRTVAQRLLQRSGYTVTAVENGAELLKALQKEKFEIVLTDISMPDMDGTQVARIIRSGERAGIDPRIPIIAMTAHAFSDDHARFLAAGINGYVAKPVNFENLLRQIEELCGKP